MDIQYIDNQLEVIEKALNWVKNVPESEQLDYKKKLINSRRELKRVRYAVSEPCSTAAFGESQMGKSYLISAMLSTPSAPFSVTDGTENYDFIGEINPSRPNSTIEATGVITRFTAQQKDNIPQGFLEVQLLSVSDIILILCEAYYNQVDYDQNHIISKEEINDFLNNIVAEKPSVKEEILSEDDILDIKEYLSKSSLLSKKCDKILNSDYFNYLISKISDLSENQITDILNLLWNREPNICQLWDDMLATYKKLSYRNIVYTRFDSVLKRKGTLLDVARLDEMYGKPDDVGSEYEPYTEVKVTEGGNSIKLLKSFFSSLIAELRFSLPDNMVDSHPFLKDLDILDFPGARRPEQIKEEKLGESKNLSTIFRRGKVSYLFNKYSAAKRISTLLFCHNNGQTGESSMGGLLDHWVNGNIGEDAVKREKFVEKAKLSPLFIVGTWFNKDLEYQDEKVGDFDTLNTRWNRRFVTILEKEVLKSLNDETHWFNNWSTSLKPFQNIYMLRDFKYSKAIYEGYDPVKNQPESALVEVKSYPGFLSDLKESFMENDFVKLHFRNPSESWDVAASCQKDGSSKIIEGLNKIAPNVAKAREEKFDTDIKLILKNSHFLLERYYHPETDEGQLKVAKRQSGTACIQIDRMTGRDSYSFGRLMDAMMISESEVYEMVHSQILGEEQPLPMSMEEQQIFMSAGLDSSVPRSENIERLCSYLGVDDESEVEEQLNDIGIDLENLLSQSKMMVSMADILVENIENLWHDKVLINRVVGTFENDLPEISSIVSSLWDLYGALDVRSTLINKVNDYINNIDKEISVGIISDYLSMQFNKFTSSFGFDFMSDKNKEELMQNKDGLNLKIDMNLLYDHETSEGINLLSDLLEQKNLLSGDSFVSKDRAFLSKFPQFKRIWRWEQQLRVGFVLGKMKKLPDFDIRANSELKTIMDNLKD